MRINLIANEANVLHRVGSNQYAFGLIKALADLDKKNDYQVFLSRSPLADLPKPRRNWWYQVVAPARLANFWALPRALPAADVTFVPGHYSPWFCPKPLVVSIMDLGFLRFPQQFTRPIYWKLKYWTKFSVRQASHILAISQSTKDDLVKFYGLPSKKITVTYPGYDQQEARFKRQDLRGKKIKKKYKIKNDYILFLSTLKPNKNIEGLLEAFRILFPRTPRRRAAAHHPRSAGLSLVIAGRQGWLYERIFAKVKQLGLADKVIFTDFVPEADVPALMRGAKAFVLPSFWEGFGIPVVAAMAIGTPVVVADRGSLPEIVGEAGIIVDPSQPAAIAAGIRQALKDYDKLSQLGIKQAKKFSWGKCARETLTVLEKFV